MQKVWSRLNLYGVQAVLKTYEIIVRISALASKMGQIQRK